MASGTFSVLGGDFKIGKSCGRISGRNLFLGVPGRWFPKRIPARDIVRIEALGEESSKSFVGAAGAGLAGGLLLGPIGAAAGLLAGGKRKAVTFRLSLADGREVVGSGALETLAQIQRQSARRPAGWLTLGLAAVVLILVFLTIASTSKERGSTESGGQVTSPER